MKRASHPLKFYSLSSRFRRTLCLALAMLALLAGTPPATATAIANSSVQFESLTITPANGSVMFSPTARSFAQAQNSLGQLISNSDTGTTASSSAAVTWANASGSADSISQTGSASANVNLPGSVTGAASSVGRGTLVDLSFSITGTTGPVSVQISLVLPYMLSLMTDASGLQASSEVIMDLTLNDNTVLFFDSLKTIGPGSSFATSGSPTITNSVTLMANQTYTLFLEGDAESSGINTPEPASFTLLLGGALFPLVRHLRSTRS